MGTLGCINDMMRRDKENRELRRASRERLNETRNRLLDVKGKRSECNVSYEQLEHIAHETREWEEKERNSFLKGKLVSSLCLQVLFINRDSSCPILQMNHVWLWRYILFSRSLYMGF